MISSLRLIKYKSKNLIKKIFFRKKKITNKVFFKTAEELNKDGYTIIKDFLKIDECKVIINDINKALEKEKKLNQLNYITFPNNERNHIIIHHKKCSNSRER